MRAALIALVLLAAIAVLVTGCVTSDQQDDEINETEQALAELQATYDGCLERCLESPDPGFCSIFCDSEYNTRRLEILNVSV